MLAFKAEFADLCPAERVDFGVSLKKPHKMETMHEQILMAQKFKMLKTWNSVEKSILLRTNFRSPKFSILPQANSQILDF